MFESAVGWATIIAAACALLGVPFLFMRRSNRKTTSNRIIRGSRNVQVAGTGNTENIVRDGNDNEQRG